MSWLSHAVHAITGTIDDAVHPVGNLFDSNSALARALANPGDPIAVGQTLNNTLVAGQSPKTQANNTVAVGQHLGSTAGVYHQDLWNNITDGVHWIGHAIIAVYHSVWDQVKRTWVGIGGKKHFDQLGNSIHGTVQKWGGERRVVAWGIVVVVTVVVIIIEIASWGSATPVIGPGWWAVIMAVLSYGVQQGMTPDPAALKMLSGRDAPSVVTNNNSSISNSNSGSSQVGSLLDELAAALGNLPPIAIIGASIAAVAGLYFLLKR